MGVKSFNSDKASTKYVFNRKAGRSIIERRPIFSPDGESIVVVVEDFVRVYNIQTGDCVRTLHTEGLVGELVAVEFSEDDRYNLYGCSENGYVTTWTWEQGAVLREIKIQIPDKMKILSFKIVDSNECFIIAADSKKSLHLGTYSVKDGGLLYEYTELKPLYYGIISVALGWCNGDRYAAFTFGTQKLYIQNLYQPHLRTEIINHNKLRIMAVAAHHKESTLAITDAIGRVTIIRGNLYDHKAVAREVLHWHFLPPLAVCFSVQGNYLISGGMEKVLVKWTLGALANRTNEKSFIPRLPGMVRFITASNSYIAVALSNNSIVVASAQMLVQGTVLERGGARGGRLLAAHRALAALLLPAQAGHLQLYSTATDTVLYNIDITETNSLPSERQNLLPLETEVTCAAISADGSWLVTSEYRNDGVIYPEEKLKFWSSQTKSTSPFKLNTCVNLSHGGCNIVALAFNNKGEFCVSSGTDQKFRIWKRDTSQRKKVLWNCLTACYYSSGIAYFMSNPVLNRLKANESVSADNSDLPYMKEIDKKNDILTRIVNNKETYVQADDGQTVNDEFAMGGVAISQDGSLIAAWFGSKLTLWDTHLCNLRTTLSHPALRPKGINVQFGNNDAAHYLVCTTENCVAVWSLLSLTVKWMVHINTTCLVSDPFSNKMAMLTTNNDVYIFRPHSSKPILSQKNLINPKRGVLQQCVFVSSGDDVRLYVVRNDSEIYCLEPEKSQENLEVISQRNLPSSKFSSLVAEQQLYDVRSSSCVETHQLNKQSLGNNAISQFLSGAPHMVPPVSLLCPSFLQHISGYEEAEQPQEDEIMEVDPQSSDDEEDKQSTYTPKAVQLWTPNYDDVKEKRLKKILKEPLLDLHITSTLFGNYLISGGMEKVLVKWTLGALANRTNEKSFIPRLPGMVRFITASNSYIAVALSNNSIVVASAQMLVQGTVLERGGARGGRLLAAHRALAALLLPAQAGHLQLYSTATDTVLYNIDITETNSLPSERQNLLPLETEVTCAAISADGSWLVTSEYRNDGVIYPEEKLKFWSSQTKSTSPFKLNTCVNLSHGGCNIVALAFNNKGEFCVSSGTDQKFRIWKRDTSQRKKVLWNCLTACYYSSGIAYFMSNPVLNRLKANESVSADNSDLPYMKEIDKKNDILTRIVNNKETYVQADDGQTVNDEFAMGGVAISQDGSLIAAWFGSKLTLWDTHLCNLRTTLSHPALRPKGINVQFGNNDAAHYLVCTTENCVAVWSLLSLTVKWMVHIKTTCLVSDPFSNKMAMLTTNNDVYIFRPHSSKPILSQKNLINPKRGVLQQCVFVSSGDDVRLYVVRNDSEIYCLEPEKSQENLEVISQRNLPSSKFSSLVAEQQLYDVRSSSCVETHQLNKQSLGNNAISQFLSGAPHMVPPVSLLCPSFLQHISGYEEAEQPQEDEIMEVDPQSSDDEEDKQSTYTPKAVQLWTPNYDDVKEKRLKKILKEPLLDLHITSTLFGNYLISGGMEKVLVKWTLGALANRTNEKSFIPRLPGMVRFITASNSYIAVALSNNSIVVASAQMLVQGTVLERGGARGGRLLAAHRALAALLLPAQAGHLQLYSTATDTVLYNIDITETNSLPSERQNLLPLETEVTCAAISADGSWLVTSEYRNDGVIYPEEKLKFWSSQTKSASPFKLNTCVNLSHGGCNIVALAFNNKGEFCVSSGTDQKFRIWKRDTSQRKKVLWNCLTACYYSSGIAYFISNPVLNRLKANESVSADNSDLPYMKEIDKKNDILTRIVNNKETYVQADDGQTVNDEFAMGGVAISQDGSLIAAWFGSKLTLWDTHLCNLRTTLSHPALRPKGINVQFGNNDAAHYLVCTTENCVAVWSLLSLTVKWMVHINTTCLVSDPFSNKMAMLTTNNDVYIFRPHSSKPILSQKNLINPKRGVLQQCVFVSSGDDVRLYVVRNDSEIYCLEPEKSQENLEVISQRNLPSSKFSSLVAEQQLYDVRSSSCVETHQLNKQSLGNNAISQFLSGAPHMVPPVSLLCPSFLQHISGYEEAEQPQEDEIMEVDPQSSDDEEDKQSTYTPKAVQLWTPNYDDVKEKRLKKILKEPLLDLHITSTLFGV